MGELNDIAFASHKAHDSKHKKQDSEMLPRFRVAQEGSTAGPFKSIVASHAQHTAALTISFDFSNTPPLLCHISAHFLSVFIVF